MEKTFGEIYDINTEKMFKNVKDLNSISDAIITQIVDFTNNAIKKEMIEYARKYALEKDRNIKLILLDKKQVEEVIDLGIKEYIRRKDEKSKNNAKRNT